MNKATIKAFIAWLEIASEGEIKRKKDEFLEAMKAVSSKEAKADIRLGLRLIDEELLARLDLHRLERRSTSMSRDG